jgi:zinc transporter 1/2/3
LDQLLSLKIALIFILFVVIYTGLIPAYSKYCRKSAFTLSLMNCFSGGVFLAMALMHILPEAVEIYYETMKADEKESQRLLRRFLEQAATNTTTSEGIVDSNLSDDKEEKPIFPLPYLLFFIGYCLVLLIDRVVAGHYSHNHERLSAGGPPCPEHPINPPVCNEHHHSVHHEHIELPQRGNKDEEGSPDYKGDSSYKKNVTPIHSEMHDHKIGHHLHHGKGHAHSDRLESIEDSNGKANNGSSKVKDLSDGGDTGSSEATHSHSHGHAHAHGGNMLEKKLMICGVNVTPLILLLAIGFHSIFEGIALGMTKNEGIFINLMIGVALHHIAATISLGVSLGQHEVNSKKAIFLIFFGLSLIEPIGIGLGIGLSSSPEFVESIVMSLAGGTFVYIACSEILVHEFEDK